MVDYWRAYRKFGSRVGMSDKAIYDSYVGFASLPFVGDFLKASDNKRAMSDYMANRGIDYGAIRYPTATIGARDNTLSSTLTLSKNVLDLYK